MYSIFIDTNILLHFKTFDELPWNSIVKDKFKLVFPPIILDELDKHKNHNNSKTAKRSRMIAAKLIPFMKGQKGRLVIEIIKERPKATTFEKFNLDPKHQDDCLLASILEYMAANSDHQTLLMTDDLMALARSETFSIKTLQLDEQMRLADGVDEEGKIIDKLKKENIQLKERIPKVDLYFKDKLKLLKIEVQTRIKTREEIRAIEMAKIKRETPLMVIDNKEPKTPFEVIALMNFNILSNEKKAEYNKNLKDYYREYEQYLNSYYDYAIKNFKSVELKFLVNNDGNMPADDIDVWLHLPDGFEASNKKMKAPQKPQAPYKPKNNFDLGHLSTGALMPNFNFNHSAPTINFDAPSIKKTNSYEVRFHCKSLKHDMSNLFDSIFLQFNTFEAMRNFTIDYKLNVGNVPYPITGKLHVAFETI
jgi:hypothetical protein